VIGTKNSCSITVPSSIFTPVCSMIPRINLAAWSDDITDLIGRNVVARGGHLEIHIAVMILGARDIGEHGVVVALLHQPHGDAAHMRGHRDACVHQGERSAADRSHGTRSIGFQDIAHHTQRIGKHGLGGYDRQQGPFSYAQRPISRRPGPRINPTSPMLNGGKL